MSWNVAAGFRPLCCEPRGSGVEIVVELETAKCLGPRITGSVQMSFLNGNAPGTANIAPSQRLTAWASAHPCPQSSKDK